MLRLWTSLGLVLAISATVHGCGCGSGALSSTEAKQLLLELPYHYKWRQVELPEGASGALAGTVSGKHHTIVHFGISLGAKPQPVPVPRVGSSVHEYGGGSGFVFNDDLEISGKNGTIQFGRQFHTAAQWHEAVSMVVDMEEKLCKAATGKPCVAV